MYAGRMALLSMINEDKASRSSQCQDGPPYRVDLTNNHYAIRMSSCSGLRVSSHFIPFRHLHHGYRNRYQTPRTRRR